jgi:superfamily II DNA or RNA helicase
VGFLSFKRIEKGPWQALERAVARLFEHIGWPHVAIIGGSGDHGGDIIVSDDKTEYIIQVKYLSNSSNTVGKTGISEVKNAMDYYSIDNGFIITNTKLSISANDYLHELNKTGYNINKIEGADLLKNYNEVDKLTAREYTPYPYQVKVIDSLWKTYTNGVKSTLIILATGLGKTFVAGTFIKRVLNDKPNARILILANQKPLINQFDRAIWKHLPKDVSTHIWDGTEKPSYDYGVTLATFQTVRNAIARGEELDSYEIMIIDEAHHALAPSYLEVIEKIKPNFLIGMTATPWRSDKKDLYWVFGCPCENCVIDIINALKNGYLSKVEYRLLCDNIDWDLIHNSSNKSYTIKDLNKRLFLQERDDEILKQLDIVWDDKKPKRAIIYCASIEHAKRMENLLQIKGYTARCLHSDLDNREVERRLREFRRGKIQILTAMNMLNEGVDVPEVDLIVFLRVTHSRIIFVQQLGRGLRLSEGKEKVIVLDFVADIKRIAATLEIDNGVRDKRKEVIKSNFGITFSSQEAKSFFEEYLKDKAAIQDYSEEDIISFPDN